MQVGHAKAHNFFFFLKPNPGVVINASKKLVETFDFTKNNLIFIPIWYGKNYLD